MVLVVGAGVLLPGCAIGFRVPASDITARTVTLNGYVGSNRSEPGEWFFKYGETTEYGGETPKRPIQFTELTRHDVSEPLLGLEPDTTYHYVLCADDQEPGVGAFCSADQTFTTEIDPADFDPTVTMTRSCEGFPPNHGVVGGGTGFPPGRPIGGDLNFPDGSSLGGQISVDENGSFGFGNPFVSSVAGTWTATITWAGGSIVDLFVDRTRRQRPRRA